MIVGIKCALPKHTNIYDQKTSLAGTKGDAKFKMGSSEDVCNKTGKKT
jgi:hypothetical protein